MRTTLIYLAKVSAGLTVAVAAFIVLRFFDGVLSLFGQQVFTSENRLFGPEIAHADIPYAQSYYQGYYETYYEGQYAPEGCGGAEASGSCEASGSAC